MVFEAMARLCGLGDEELARFLNVPQKRIGKWRVGAVPVSDGALNALRMLHDRQQAAADGLIASWVDGGRAGSIDFAVAVDADMARLMGWPSKEAQLVVAAIAQAEIAPARVIAREVGARAKKAPQPPLASPESAANTNVETDKAA